MKLPVYAALATLALATVMTVPSFAQTTSDKPSVGQDLKGAGHDTADASKTVAHKTVSGTKTVAKTTAHGTKVTAGKTAYNTKKVGDKVAGKPTPPKSEDPHYSDPH